jgi:Tfp pilus assembly PilM family ATPase/Tfp pilus assembly protein PilN
MQSIGLTVKEEHMVVVSLNKGLRDTYLLDYQILPFLDFKDQEKEEVIVSNLERFLKKHREGADNLFLALPREQAILQFFSMPLAVEESLRTTLGYEMDRYTPFSFDDVYFDYSVVKRSIANNLLYLMLLTVKKEVVDFYLNLCKRINVRPRSIEITSTALFNAFQKNHNGSEEPLYPDWIQKSQIMGLLHRKFPQLFPKQEKTKDKERQTVEALIEYTDTHCELNLITQGKLYYSRSMPLPQSTGTPVENHGEQLHLPIILREVNKGLLQIPDQKTEGSFVRFFLSGREISKDYLNQAGEELQIDFTPLQDLPIKVEERNERSKLPLLAVAIGSALKGIGQVPLDINLIPQALRPKKKRSKRKIISAVLIVFLVVIGGILLVQNVLEERAQLEALDKQLIEIKREVESLEKMQEEINRVQQYTATIEQIRENDLSKLNILSEFTEIIPVENWLTDLDYKGDDKRVKISGYALSASRLIPILEESNLFENVKFTSPITKGGSVKENFKIEMNISMQNK